MKISNTNIHLKLLALALLSALLLTLGWPVNGLFPLLWVGFVPLFFIHHLVIENKLATLWALVYGYIAFLGFNIGTTWWVYNASAGGAIMAFVLNSLLMSLPFMVLHKFGLKQQNSIRIWPFIWAWLAFEYLHYRWDGTWTWLTLGNGFANVPWLVQWYEFTGVAGGSLWVLWLNKNIFHFILKYPQLDKQTRIKKVFNIAFFKVFAPAFLSFYISQQRHSETVDKRISSTVLVVQPNIDPYNEKFSSMSDYDQALKMLHIAEEHMDSTVQLVAFPETALVGHLDERNLEQEETIKLVRAFMQKHPGVSVITGADSYKAFLPGEQVSKTARTWDNGTAYDVYNTAFFLNASQAPIASYHKSKLVPGVECLPFASVLKYVEKYAIDLGGTTGSLGVDAEPTVFEVDRMNKVAPIICYESIFGAYITEYVKKGATLLCIITNDGWWGDTPGYKQHLAYANLRAIETRRYIARSANTGISGFIDDEGKVLSTTSWWQTAALKHKVMLNTETTFYVEHGDVINEIALLVSFYFVLGLFFPNRLVIKTNG